MVFCIKLKKKKIKSEPWKNSLKLKSTLFSHQALIFFHTTAASPTWNHYGNITCNIPINTNDQQLINTFETLRTLFIHSCEHFVLNKVSDSSNPVYSPKERVSNISGVSNVVSKTQPMKSHFLYSIFKLYCRQNCHLFLVSFCKAFFKRRHKYQYLKIIIRPQC